MPFRIGDFDSCVEDRKYFTDKYNGTIVLVKGVPKLLQVGDDRVLLGGSSVDFGTSGIEAGITPFLPDSQWFTDAQWLHMPVYMQRIPNRQWHRSFHPNQYEFTFPHLAGAVSLTGQMPSYATNVGVAKLLSIGDTNTIDRVLKTLKKDRKWGGLVLSPEYALTRNGDGVYNLCNSTGVVGLLVEAERVIYVGAQLYKEVSTFLMEANETWALKQTKCL